MLQRPLRYRARWVATLRLALALATALGALAPLGGRAGTPYTGFFDPAFERVWAQADGPVAHGDVQRSWVWGPLPVGVARELYVESSAPNALRLVQYFDKARMEITRPDGDADSLWYVTTGLLVKELVSGQRQDGDFSHYPAGAAGIPVAGDPLDPDTPTYADFATVATLDGQTNRVADRTGQTVAEGIAPGGVVSAFDPPVDVALAHYESTLGHNIPAVFWDWLNDADNGLSAYGSWVYPMGYPITEPYWLLADVGGVEHAVLVQLFERRVLSYTPSNAPEWQVEMGNVGLHYLRAFEPPYTGPPIWSADGARLAFTRQAEYDGNRDIYGIDIADGTLIPIIDSAFDETLTGWLPDGRLAFHAPYPAGEEWTAESDGPAGLTALAANGVWSPDGSKVARIEGDDQAGNVVIVQDADGGNPRVVASGVANGALQDVVAWSPDSQWLAFWELFRFTGGHSLATLAVVRHDGTEQRVVEQWDYTSRLEFSWAPDGNALAVARLSTDGASALFVVTTDGSTTTPLVTPDGQGSEMAAQPDWYHGGGAIAFIGGSASGPNGIWMISAGGEDEIQLTTDPRDHTPRWSPTRAELAFLRATEIWIVDSEGEERQGTGDRGQGTGKLVSQGRDQLDEQASGSVTSRLDRLAEGYGSCGARARSHKAAA